MNKTEHNDSDSKCDVLLLFVNDNERDAVFEAAKSFVSEPEIVATTTLTYHNFGDIRGTRVMGLQTRMGAVGRGSSGPATLTAIHDLNPEYIIAVGIAFGMDQNRKSQAY